MPQSTCPRQPQPLRPHPHPHRKRRLPLCAAALLGLLVAATPATLRGSADTYQDQINNAQHQRDQLGGLINSLQQQIRQAQNREALLREEVAALDAQITQQEQRINDQQARLDQIAAELAATRDQLDRTRERLRKDKVQLAHDVVAIYELGNNTAINNLLGSDNFNQFWQQLIDLRRLAGSQQTTLTAVQHEELVVNQLVADIAVKQTQQKQALADEAAVQAALARISADQQEQTKVMAQLRDAAAQLQQTHAARQSAEAQLEAVVANDQRQLALAEQSAREVESQINALKAAQAAAAARGGGNGHFIWPEQGPITQGFGCTSWPYEPYDPNCPSRHFHTGIDIGAPGGTDIVAGDAGIAYTYVSSYGYGYHIIIVHGHGWVSVYGHLAGFAVGNGQAVGRGQLIGYEGSTGNSTGPHLHFEVRLNDVPQNPLQYLP